MLKALPIAALSLASIPAVAQEIHEVTLLEMALPGEDYAPIWMDSGFVMVSIRESASAIDFRDAESGKPLSDLYWVPFQGEKAGNPVLFSSVLSTPVNEGPAAFGRQGRMICYTRNLVLPKKLSNLRGAAAQLGLFLSELNEGQWSAPVAFPHNSVKHGLLHPALSSDGKTLIFASNMPGGKGGMDLYSSTLTNGAWSQPQPLASTVNSEANEVYPQFQPDGSLVFASDRTGGKGKLDLYRTELHEGQWTRPEALPEPINGPANDHGYSSSSDGRRALFASDRSGVERIHHVLRTVPKFRECAPQQPNNYCYRFSSKPIAAMNVLPVDHVWDLGDGTRVNSLHTEHCYTEPGDYTVRSLLIDRKTGQIFHTLSSHQLELRDHVQAYVAAPDTVRTGRSLELHSGLSHLPDIIPEEYHWDMGDGNILRGASVVHQFRNAGTYEVRLDVLSAPDGSGTIRNKCNTKPIVVIDRFKEHEDMAVTAIYQDALGNTHVFSYQELPFDESQLRMDALDDATFAVQLFATRERMSLDDPRFAEIKRFYPVIERFDPITSTYIYLVGEAKNMEEMYAVFKKVKELQFMDAEVFALEDEKLIDLSQLDLASLEELNNKKLRTNAIHFAYKSADLDSTSSTVLDQIQHLLKQHKDLMLVIEAHTDAIGGTSYNVDLSQSRAQTVVDHLARRGVDSDRLIAIGHGKNQPIASNKTEQGRAQNRRVEFRMIVKGEEQAYQQRR
jgi:outer membrane protein OmpA-like peptidoglycan-associated protein